MNSKKKKKSKNRQAMRQLLIQPLESRVVLAASMGWDGAGQGSAELTYYIANHPSSLTQAETNQAIETALSAWSSVANIKFTQTDQPGLKDSLDFSFSNIDGVPKTLAQSYYPDDVNSARLAGDVQFDSSENWEVGNSEGNKAFDLTYVAAHEIGHALGLDHSDAAGSVMSEMASANTEFTGLSAADKAAILQLYAAADTSTSSDDSTESSDSTSSGSDTTTSDSGTTDTTDSDTVPFPKDRWRHGGRFQPFGSRFDASSSFNHNVYLPSDVNGDSSVTPSDAITVINILNNGVNVSSLDLNNLGLVDTNGDGSVSPSDALIVINTLNGSTRVTVILVTANSTSSTGTSPTDESDTTTETTDSGSTDTTSTDTTSTDTTDTEDASDTTETGSSDTGTTDSDTTDSDTTDSDTTDSDTTDSDTTDSDSTDSTDCNGGSSSSGSSSSGGTSGTSTNVPNRSAMLAWFNADNLISKFDADSSGTLTESEVPDHLWQLLVDSNIDSDADSAVSQSELQTAIAAARQDLFNSKDSDNDGQLTLTEVGSRIWNSLSSADTDSSGGVSFTEFDTYISENSNNGMPHGGGRGHHGHGGMGGEHRGGHVAPELWQLAADSLFAEFDADSDGILTSSELPSKILSDLVGKSVDSNSDGSISTDELKTAITAARETYFTSKDADADGQLSQSEVGNRKWRFLSSADTNSDGTVSLEEFQAWTPSKPSGHEHETSDTPTITASTGSTTTSSGNTVSSVIGRLVGRFGRR